MNAGDERDIHALLIRYCTGIDARDWPLFASCFTEGTVVDYGKYGRWDGRAVLVEHFERAHDALGPTLHRLSNVVVEGDARAAQTSSYINAVLMPKTPEGRVLQVHGVYQDQLVKSALGWLIKRRVLRTVLAGVPIYTPENSAQ